MGVNGIDICLEVAEVGGVFCARITGNGADIDGVTDIGYGFERPLDTTVVGIQGVDITGVTPDKDPA